MLHFISTCFLSPVTVDALNSKEEKQHTVPKMRHALVKTPPLKMLVLLYNMLLGSSLSTLFFTHFLANSLTSHHIFLQCNNN